MDEEKKIIFFEQNNGLIPNLSLEIVVVFFLIIINKDYMPSNNYSY